MNAASAPPDNDGQGPVLYYDGVCGLCNRLVQFVVAHDGSRRIRYAPLQGDHARQTLVPRGFDPEALDTVHVLTDDDRILVKSRAVFFILRQLGGPWRVLAGLRWLPRFVTDTGYDLVASVRYRIWGRTDACALPPPDARALFLE